jgi:hypothetical protein
VRRLSLSNLNEDFQSLFPSLFRVRPREWMGCVKDEMKIKGVSIEMTTDRREWKEKTCCANPT